MNTLVHLFAASILLSLTFSVIAATWWLLIIISRDIKHRMGK